MTSNKRKTPDDISSIERERIRFFLSQKNVGATLKKLNLSPAWLPEILAMRVIESPTELTAWIMDNFDDPNAVLEVVKNLNFFDEASARLLEESLAKRRPHLPNYLYQCWRLIIRHIYNQPTGFAYEEWFDAVKRIRTGDQSQEIIVRVAKLFRPTLRIQPRHSFMDEGSPDLEPSSPFELLSVRFEPRDGVQAKELISNWTQFGTDKTTSMLLSSLYQELEASLDEANEYGLESALGYDRTDSDVPSVAEHRQNDHHSGFLPIVRAIADLWLMAVENNVDQATELAINWLHSPHKLIKRLSLFCFADHRVAAETAARSLLEIPSLFLFLTNTSVEVSRLIRERWNDFPQQLQTQILERLISGPPPDSFRSDPKRNVDRCVFDVLGSMERRKLSLSDHAAKVLSDLKSRYPEWRLRPMEQDGFHTWFSGVHGVVDDPGELANTPISELITRAAELKEASDFRKGDAWRAYCKSNPGAAFEGLLYSAQQDIRPAWAWNTFLWSTSSGETKLNMMPVATVLRTFPSSEFKELSEAASSWLLHNFRALKDSELWPIWDRISTYRSEESETNLDFDNYHTAINRPTGKLAEIVILYADSVPREEELPGFLSEKFDSLYELPDPDGLFAKLRFASDLPFLFSRMHDWTIRKLVPLFNWEAPNPASMWAARKYSNYIGPPELFDLLKEPFLEIFRRSETTAEDMRIFSQWLTAIVIANKSADAGYNLTPIEARSALRDAGQKGMVQALQQVAVEFRAVEPTRKTEFWQDIGKYFFERVWPVDAELQSHKNNLEFVKILRCSGNAFGLAAETIIPFISDEPDANSPTLYSLADAEEIVYESSPSLMLELVYTLLGNSSGTNVHSLTKILSRISSHDPSLSKSKKFKMLNSIAAQ